MHILLLSAAFAAPAEPPVEEEPWDIETSPEWPELFRATLDEGTWMSVDVNPRGTTIAFDLLGDLYVMPITGGDATVVTSGPAWDQDPRWSPDGRSLMFVSDVGGNQEIHIRDLDSGETTTLTKGSPERFGEATWSPDGQWVVARKRITDTRSIGMCELWLYSVAGGDGLQLTQTSEMPFPVDVSFTPDGTGLYFSSTPWRFDYDRDPNNGIYDLWHLDLASGDTRRLTGEGGSAMRPTVNPQTGEIALLRRQAKETVLELYTPETGARRRVGAVVMEHDNQEGFALNGLYPHMAWTPNGEELIAWDDGKIQAIDVASGVQRVIPFKAKAELALGETIRHEFEVAGHNEVQAQMIRWPTVSPDGTRVVFGALGRLWVQSLDPVGPARVLTDGARHVQAPTWHPEGEHIAYTTWHDQEQGDVRALNVNTGEERVLTSLPAQYLAPAFSPDGTQMTWLRGSGAPLRGKGANQELWFRVERMVDGKVVDVMQWGWSGGSQRARAAQFNADGTRLLLVDDEPAGTPNTAGKIVLKSVNLEGKDERIVARWGAATEAIVSGDGTQVAWIEKGKVHSAALPPAAGKTLELAPGKGPFTVVGHSEILGSWPGFAGDVVTWSSGNMLHVGEDTTRMDARLPRERGRALVAYTNARILTMGKAGVVQGAIVVDGERIVSVGGAVPAGAKVVDLQGKTVMPGLIDVHAHLHYGASDAQPQRSWRHELNLAYGVTTTFDPSAHDDTVFATAERIEAGLQEGPRSYSTGKILYGAKSRGFADIQTPEDAVLYVQRAADLGATGVKSYQQPSRAQRQWVLEAAREVGINVYPEGGGDFLSNLAMVVDGHTGVEHALPVAPLYADAIGLYAASGAGYTPTLLVAYGGLTGEHFYYQSTDLLSEERLLRYMPQEQVDRIARRQGMLVHDDDWYFLEVSRAAGVLAEAGVRVNLGGHGQLQGLGPHWELWALAEGMGNQRALEAATINGAWYLGMEDDLGSIEKGKLADFVIIDGDPLQNIQDSTQIVEVVKGGIRYDPDTLERK